MGGDDGDRPGTESVDGSAVESTEKAAPIRAPANELGSGDCVGRYTLRALIGTGGMGRVFAADDPELGRAVAIKLIREDKTSPRARARLLREAQALARLHHSNIVTVFDVGTQGDQVFIAMELIEGVTLDEWLRATSPSWRKVIETFLAAGRALAAAHAAGVVHRDFKPANVMVAGDRVVVVDFGLARAGENDAESDAATSSDSMLGVNVTLTGERLGTPFYMSPEQRAGSSVTASSDQYSFCVTLWQALHGVPPTDERRRPNVPGWVNAAMLRGLSAEPDARWPSMSELLAALERDPARRRRQILAGIAILAVLVVGIVALQRPRVDPCAGAAGRLTGIWDGARKEVLAKAFAATKLPYAEDTWSRVDGRIDAYASSWIDMNAETCRATRNEGRQSDTLMDLRMGCLELRRESLRALTDVWAGGVNKAAVDHATTAADSLSSLAECADGRALAERVPLPGDPALVANIAKARAQVQAAQALRLAFRLKDAQAKAAVARLDADATGWPPIRAEAATAVADVMTDLNQQREAEWVAAYQLAFAAHDDRLAAHGLVELTFYLGTDESTAARALSVADIADGVIVRSGGDETQRVDLASARGDAYRSLGKLDEAKRVFEAAYDEAVQKLGPHSIPALRVRARLSEVMQRLGRYAEARRIGAETLEMFIAIYGANHPKVVGQLNTLGNIADSEGEMGGAGDYYRRALAIAEATDPNGVVAGLVLNNLTHVDLTLGDLAEADEHGMRALRVLTGAVGPESADVGKTLLNLAKLRRLQGRYDEARANAERSREIKIKALGPTNPSIAFALVELGLQGIARGDVAGALPQFQQAFELREKAYGADHPWTLEAKIHMGRSLALLHRCSAARPLLTEALAVLDKLPDAPPAHIAEALTDRASCDLAEGRAREAEAALSRALDIEDKTHETAVDHGASRWPYARALWALGRHDEALAAARKAAEELGANADGTRDRTAALAWLSLHD